MTHGNCKYWFNPLLFVSDRFQVFSGERGGLQPHHGQSLANCSVFSFMSFPVLQL